MPAIYTLTKSSALSRRSGRVAALGSPRAVHPLTLRAIQPTLYRLSRSSRPHQRLRGRSSTRPDASRRRPPAGKAAESRALRIACSKAVTRERAASPGTDDLPGPLRLCATHTEYFRQNSLGWKINWEHEAPEPISVTTPATSSVGLSGPTPAQAAGHEPTSRHPALESLLQLPGWTAKQIEARVAARRKGRT